MKTISNIPGATLVRSFAALLLGAAMLLPMSNVHSADATVQTTGGITHASGGVGDDSIARLEALAKNFNLKLVFALQSGNYVSDVKVVIADAKGKTLLDAASAGPWFLVKLPAGNYQVVATFEGKAVKRPVTVGTAKLQTVDFRWAAE